MKPQNSNKDDDCEKVLVRRLELAEELYALTTSQREAIRSKNWDGLKAILNEKDRRIHQFQETEKCLKMTESVPSHKTILTRIESRLLAIQSLEEECRRSVKDRKNQAVRTLREVKRAHEGIKRFKSHRLGAPRFVDLRK